MKWWWDDIKFRLWVLLELIEPKNTFSENDEMTIPIDIYEYKYQIGVIQSAFSEWKCWQGWVSVLCHPKHQHQDIDETQTEPHSKMTTTMHVSIDIIAFQSSFGRNKCKIWYSYFLCHVSCGVVGWEMICVQTWTQRFDW